MDGEIQDGREVNSIFLFVCLLTLDSKSSRSEHADELQLRAQHDCSEKESQTDHENAAKSHDTDTLSST